MAVDDIFLVNFKFQRVHYEIRKDKTLFENIQNNTFLRMLKVLLIIYFESYEFYLQRVPFHFFVKYVSVSTLFSASSSIYNFCSFQENRVSITRLNQFMFKGHYNVITPTSLISQPLSDKRDFFIKNKLKI